MALDLFKKVIQRQNVKKLRRSNDSLLLKVYWWSVPHNILLKAQLKCCNFALLCVLGLIGLLARFSGYQMWGAYCVQFVVNSRFHCS